MPDNPSLTPEEQAKQDRIDAAQKKVAEMNHEARLKYLREKREKEAEIQAKQEAEYRAAMALEMFNRNNTNRDNRSAAAKDQIYTLKNNEALSNMSDFRSLLRSNLIYDRSDLCWYEKFNRFGALDPFNNLSNTREYLFFTKPDCHIFTPGTTDLQPMLEADPFFIDMAARYPHVIQMLQSSAGSLSSEGDNDIVNNPFMTLLSNSVKNTLDLQGLTAGEMDGPSNMYGSHISYRKDAWTGDENVDFSLEFEDSRFLEVYLLLKTYEEYQRYKSVGLIYPPNIDGAKECGDARHNFNRYIKNKELHDVFGVYRFIVGEDYQTILYYAYICGCYFNNVPRDAFNDLKNGAGLTYTADFKGYCVLDMDPRILSNFNKLIFSSYGDDAADGTQLPLYGTITDISDSNISKETNARVNGDWAKYPLIGRIDKGSKSLSDRAWFTSSDMAYQYKLLWYTDD